jgi:hypothetical protein
MIGMEFAEIAQLVIGSGALVYLGRIDQKIRTLCREERDHETRLRVLERLDPVSPAPVRAVLRRVHDAD